MTLRTFDANLAIADLGIDPNSGFGIAMWKFLFDHKYFNNGIRFERAFESPQETAKRIRKFCYYFMRKGEIFAEYNEVLQTGAHKFQGEERVINQLQEV